MVVHSGEDSCKERMTATEIGRGHVVNGLPGCTHHQSLCRYNYVIFGYEK
nr:hypothetical protein Itr_chr12CG10770 [Ipomoea trifida]